MTTVHAPAPSLNNHSAPRTLAQAATASLTTARGTYHACVWQDGALSSTMRASVQVVRESDGRNFEGHDQLLSRRTTRRDGRGRAIWHTTATGLPGSDDLAEVVRADLARVVARIEARL